MDWMKLNEILLKLNKYGPLCGRPKRPQNMNIYSLPCLHLSLIPNLSLLSRGRNMGFIFLIFAALSLPFSLLFSWHSSITAPLDFLNSFLRAISSQSNPRSDKNSFQRLFTGSEPISGYSSHSLMAGF